MPSSNNRGIVTIGDVTRTAVTIEKLSKHVSSATNTRNNKRVVFSVLRSLPSSYEQHKENRLSQLSFETSAYQDMSLRAEELN
jgi:hypothetical protein